jgi:hypothetical protein
MRVLDLIPEALTRKWVIHIPQEIIHQQRTSILQRGDCDDDGDKNECVQ